MKVEEPLNLRNPIRAQNHPSQQLQPKLSSPQQSNRSPQSPTVWKKYIADSQLRSQKKRETNPSEQSGTDLLQRELRELRIPYQDPSIQPGSKLEEQRRRKEEMIRRVEEIQRRVNPILKSNRSTEEVDENFGWNNRMEQRLLKLQTNIDMIEKELQIKIERRLLEVEKEWSEKFNNLLSHYEADTKPTGRVRIDTRKTSMKAGYYGNEEEEEESEGGYFTRRELEGKTEINNGKGKTRTLSRG